MKYLSNAFSLQMLQGGTAICKKINFEEACTLSIDAKSIVGHADIASIISHLLGFAVAANRVSVSLLPGDILVVGQYVGGRLPEGCKTIPGDAAVEWYVVEISN